MKKLTLISLSYLLLSFMATAQTSKLEKVQEKVATIENKCQYLFQVIFYEDDEKNDTNTELSAYIEDETIYKIKEQIRVKNAIITSVIHLENDIPVKITTIEENFELENGEPNYEKGKEVFRMEIFVFDWQNDDAKVITKGNAVLSDGACSMYEYETTIKNVKTKLNE